MILEIFSYLQGTDLWNLFQYLTLRSALAAITAFAICILAGPSVIRILRRKKIGERVEMTDSERLAELHGEKKGTPTMGGLIILLAVLASVLLFGNLRNQYVVLALLGTAAFGIVGILDDWIKLNYRERPGLRASAKLVLQTGVSLALAAAIVMLAKSGGDPNPYEMRIPFIKDAVLNLAIWGGLIYLLFAAFIIVATSNAVNLTDGLDGLATGCALIATVTFGVIIYVIGREDFTDYLLLPHVPGSAELTIVCAALSGACLGFLWFNSHPAQVFMGDTGSLPIGGLLGFMAIVSKQELILPIICGVFVIEAGSVVLQVGSFKLRGKRIFKIAPIHHQFEFEGWHESKIVVRFWIIAVIFAIIGLATLKVR